jgi:iron complex transport system permease protein
LSPQELPVGAITALIGAPFFCYIYFGKSYERNRGAKL